MLASVKAADQRASDVSRARKGEGIRRAVADGTALKQSVPVDKSGKITQIGDLPFVAGVAPASLAVPTVGEAMLKV